ncbi:MAG: hypothetical protein V7676_15155 [Parasphingorhabdus sp.]|jgi:hypothetical protein|uniref:hypothetical protein n=1 Tax=Parasphingorhabdus sp. TaxID=2709688 RepID=UPI003001CF87|tara:strand:- start:55 stop:231 length:177 start_codon:yes stop_codon:yes gene_type:complete
MSLPIQQDPGNPGSANSVHWQQTQKAVVKRSPATGSDWTITWFILGIFGAGIIATILQ